MLLKKQPKGDTWQGTCRSVFFLLWRGPVARRRGTYVLQASYMKHVPEQLTVAMALVGMVTSRVRNRRAVGREKEDVWKRGEKHFLGEALYKKLFFGLRDIELGFGE